jgi:chromosome segregation ATPase
MDAKFLKTLLDLKNMRRRLADCMVDEDKNIWAEVGKLDEFLARMEEIIEAQNKQILKQEIEMGRAADAIGQLQAKVDTATWTVGSQASTIRSQASQISDLQRQIATLKSQPSEDAADVAAIDGVLGPVVVPQVVTTPTAAATDLSGSNAPSGQTNVSQGTPAGS